MTHALLARGRAVDAGSCPSETTDQRGFPRRIDEPTVPNVKDACDIGAYEAGLPPTADLIISQSVDKTSVKQGDLLTYTVRVRNLGPETSPNVVVNDVLSSGVTFVEIRTNRGTTTAPPKGETGTVTWNLGDLLDQANETAEIKVTVLVRGKTTITNTATVAVTSPIPTPPTTQPRSQSASPPAAAAVRRKADNSRWPTLRTDHLGQRAGWAIHAESRQPLSPEKVPIP